MGDGWETAYFEHPKALKDTDARVGGLTNPVRRMGSETLQSLSRLPNPRGKVHVFVHTLLGSDTRRLLALAEDVCSAPGSAYVSRTRSLLDTRPAAFLHLRPGEPLATRPRLEL